MVSLTKTKRNETATIEKHDLFSSAKRRNSESSTSSSSTKSKKTSSEGLFANLVAGLLGSICEIDQSQIESKLRKKATISLKNVRLLPKIIHRTSKYEFELKGMIKSCTLSWKWNIRSRKKKGIGPVKSSSLKIEGLNVQVEPKIIKSDKGVSDSNGKDSNAEKVENDETGLKENWRTKIMKQILDDIALRIVSARITIGVDKPVALNSGSTLRRHIVISLKDVQLDSLGRHAQTSKQSQKSKKGKDSLQLPLLQRLHIGLISSQVETLDNQGVPNVLPLFDPFRYKANLKKFHGDRFGGGVRTGYDISGDILRNSTTTLVPLSPLSLETGGPYPETKIIQDSKLSGFHAVEINSSDGEVETVLPRGIQHKYSKPPVCLSIQDKKVAKDVINISLGKDQVDAIMSLFSIIRIPPPLQKPAQERNQYAHRGRLGSIKAHTNVFQNSTKDLTKASKFDLPLEAISIQLPNGTHLNFPQCRCTKHKGDSQSVMFTGKDGVMVNHKTFFEFGREYSVNFGDKAVVFKPLVLGLKGDSHEGDRQMLQIQLSTLQQVTKGLGDINDILRKYVPPPEIPAEIPWSLKIEGEAQLIL